MIEKQPRAIAQIGLAGCAVALCLVASWAIVHPPAAAAASTCPGKNGQVAVVTDSERNLNAWSIGLVEPEMHVRPLFRASSFPENFPTAPSFSCDGSKIVYQVDEEGPCQRLEIVSLDGQKHEITTPHLCPHNPAFLANGNIVFGAYPPRRGSNETYEVSADGSHLHRLFKDPENACTTNGRLFVSGLESSKVLLLLNAKGRVLHRLAPRLPFKVGQYRDASLSADGKWVIYEKQTYSHGHGPNQSSFYLERTSGTDRRRIDTKNASELTFSPDGRWIAFIRSFIPGNSEGNVYAMSVSHPATVKKLTDLPSQNPSQYLRSPAWGAK